MITIRIHIFKLPHFELVPTASGMFRLVSSWFTYQFEPLYMSEIISSVCIKIRNIERTIFIENLQWCETNVMQIVHTSEIWFAVKHYLIIIFMFIGVHKLCIRISGVYEVTFASPIGHSTAAVCIQTFSTAFYKAPSLVAGLLDI